MLGKEPESAILCDCTKIKSYVLFTTYITLESPLKCTKCFGIVPLYKIPATAEEEYYNVIGWESDYQSCDSLQMNCMVGERFATNQLSKYDSQLTKFGLKVCQSIENSTNKRVFYYLYKGRAKNYESELAGKCPGCDGDWYLKSLCIAKSILSAKNVNYYQILLGTCADNFLKRRAIVIHHSRIID